MTTYTGKVYTPPEVKLSKKGNWYSRFAIRKNGTDIFQVICFGEKAQESKRLKIGTEIIVEGNLAEDTDAEDVPKIKAYSWKVPGERETAREAEVREAGGEAAYAKRKAEYLKQKEAEGQVLCTDCEGKRHWVANSEVIEVDGKPMAKIEFAMKQLGGKTVTDILRDANIDYKNQKSVQGYLKVLDDLVNLAKTEVVDA